MADATRDGAPAPGKGTPWRQASAEHPLDAPAPPWPGAARCAIRQELAAACLAAGFDTAKTARRVGVAPGTLKQWRRRPDFQARVAAHEAETAARLREGALAAVIQQLEAERAAGSIATARWLLTRLLFAGIVASGHGAVIAQLQRAVEAALKGFPLAARWDPARQAEEREAPQIAPPTVMEAH